MCCRLVAACRMEDYAEAGGVKREGSALASRAAGLLLQLLSDGPRDPLAAEARAVAACQLAALHLLQQLLQALPSSLRSHGPALEAALAGITTGTHTSEGR